MNINDSYSTTMYETIFAQIYIFMEEKYFLLEFYFMVKKLKIIAEIRTFGSK